MHSRLALIDHAMNKLNTAEKKILLDLKDVHKCGRMCGLENNSGTCTAPAPEPMGQFLAVNLV